MGMQQVALSSFGGGLSAWSQRIVVEERQWLDNEAFITGLTVARLFPGPNQINMAVYIGSRFHGLSGALVALAGMLLLPFSVLLLLGLAYFELHMVMAVDRVLAGVITASAGMALSMGFKLVGGYNRDPVAMLLGEDALQERRLSRPEKAGENGHRHHVFLGHPSSPLSCRCSPRSARGR